MRFRSILAAAALAAFAVTATGAQALRTPVEAPAEASSAPGKRIWYVVFATTDPKELFHTKLAYCVIGPDTAGKFKIILEVLQPGDQMPEGKCVTHDFPDPPGLSAPPERSATTPGTGADDDRPGNDETPQLGLVNLSNTDVLHNVNAVLGVCESNINVLGVQVPLQDVANGIGVPVLSPGEDEASGDTLDHCAAGGIVGGGTNQGN